MKITAVFMILPLLALSYAYINSRIVHIKYVRVRLSGLPDALDGARVLFASDIDIKTASDARNAAGLFKRLELLKADMLILGGGYTADTLPNRLNAVANDGSLSKTFIESLSDFNAPLGKYAISGKKDPNAQALKAAFEAAGFMYMDNAAAKVKGLFIAGLSGGANYSGIAAGMDGDECVLLFANSPEEYAYAQTVEAKNGGAWADVMLMGCNKGGQIRLFGRDMLKLNEFERKYRGGVYKDGGMYGIATTGVGCELFNIRVNARAEVLLITLEKKVS